MLAVWVQKTVADTPAEADALTSQYAEAGITDIFYYNGYTSNYTALAYLTTAAHRAGLRVHAWLCFGADLYGLNSSWRCAGVAFTNFGIEAARVKMAAIVQEILAAVPDIDGFHLDYMRSPVIDDTTYYTAAEVTDAVDKIATASGGKTLSVAVKAYENDWNRWSQNWPAWLNDNLIDLACPMCYHPLDGETDTAYHVRTWENSGAPMWLIVPGLAVIDDSDVAEPLKTAAQMGNEAALFVSLGFGDAALFDNRATDAQIMAVAAELPVEEPEENEMGIYDTLIAEADAIDARATTEANTAQADYDTRMENVAAARLTATNLRIQAAALQEADEKAEQVADAAAAVSALL